MFVSCFYFFYSYFVYLHFFLFLCIYLCIYFVSIFFFKKILVFLICFIMKIILKKNYIFVWLDAGPLAFPKDFFNRNGTSPTPRSGCPGRPALPCLAPQGTGSDWKNLPGTAQFLSTQTDTMFALIYKIFPTRFLTKAKPNINSVEVHPQLSNNRHRLDGVVGSLCLSCLGSWLLWKGLH